MNDNSPFSDDGLVIVSRIFGYAALAVGILSIAGLLTGITVLRSLFPGARTMAFSTTLFIILAGLILVEGSLRRIRGAARIAILGLLAVIAVAESFEFSFGMAGTHFMVESWMVQFADTAFRQITVPVPALTSLLVIIASIALFLVMLDPSRKAADPRERDLAGVLGIFLALAGITLFLGFIYGAPSLDGTELFTTAASSAVAFVFLGLSVTAAAGRAAIPARYFTGSSTTASLLRSFVPLAIGIIVVQASFHDFVDQYLVNSRALIFSVSIVVFSVATGIIVTRTGRRVGAALEDAEAQQKATEQQLRAANEELVNSNEELTMMGEELRSGMERLFHSEQALLESRGRLEKTQEMAGLGSWDLDLVANRLEWSDEVYRIFGLEPNVFPATYEAFLETIHPDDREAVNAAFSRSLTDGSDGYQIDHRIIRKSDGSTRYVHEKCEHIRNGDGRIVRSSGLVHDITGRKQAEEKLKQVIASWNATFNAMNDRVCLMDPGGRVLQCNESMLALAGLPAGDIVGKQCHDVMHQSAAFAENCPLQAMLKSGKREVLELPVGDRWFVVSADPVTNEEGAITGAVHVMRDITDARKAQDELVRQNEELAAVEEELRQNVDELGKKEQELRETSQYLENLIEYANAPIIVWDPQFRITRFNRAFERLTGRPASSVIGQPLEILFPRDHMEGSLDLIKKTLTGERWESVEIPILHAHGNVRTMLWNSATLYQQDGKTVSSIIAQGQDITDRKLAEEQLQEALASWKVTFNAMNDKICLLDRNGLIGLCNEEMTRFLGLPQDEATGRRCSELMGCDALGHGETPIDRMLASGKRESAEIALRDQWFAVTADPIKNSAGSIIGGVQILRDITEKKQAEEAIRAGEEKLRMILDSTGEAIYGIDPLGRCTFLNPACLRLLGYSSKEELLGKEMHQVIHARRPDGSRQPASECPVTRSLSAGKGGHFEGEVFSRADGTTFPVEISSYPQWKDGKIAGAVVAFSDITARKQAEEALHTSEVRYRTLFETAKDGILILDGETGAVTDANPFVLAMLETERNDLIGKTIPEIGFVQDKKLAENALGEIKRNGYLRYVDLLMKTKTGRSVDVEFVSSVYSVNNKNVIQCNVRDITARKRLEMEMVQSLREKEVLLKEIHHRVKNNIQVISSILSLQSNQAHDPETREIFRETQNKVKGIALIHEKLYRSKSLSQINYADYLRDISAHTFQSYSINPDQVGIRIDAGDVAINIDKAVPLSLIVTELLSNSLKHAFPGGRKGEIAIGIRPEGSNLVLSFADNGIGLPQSVTFDKGDTLGMGLLAGLTRQLSGTIAVDRTGGTKYTLTFPVTEEDVRLGIPLEPSGVPAAKTGG